MVGYADIDIELERLLALEPAVRQQRLAQLAQTQPERAEAIRWLLAQAPEALADTR